MNPNNIYAGTFDNVNWYQITLNGETFDPGASLKIRNHSPDGFAYGYQGSGPAQLALAILLEEAGEEIAQKYYQDFKRSIIANFDKDSSWTLTSEDVRKWLEKNAQEGIDGQ